MPSDHVTDNEVARNASIHDMNDLFDDFGGTFMLDEELELEHKALDNDGSIKRAFHHYRGQHCQKDHLKKLPDLEKLLREEHRSLEDFRAKERDSNTMHQDN
ncbi:hypothetical protein SAY86_025619 [Trapa natans]|uniref:Uncharacterized protein n=1 Tax=Trapa natans TaxID=22666 RepID=A0AAN7KCD5_TRANT|nr:hypothetical protein SAY86_025619 [Trapa natans]